MRLCAQRLRRPPRVRRNAAVAPRDDAVEVRRHPLCHDQRSPSATASNARRLVRRVPLTSRRQRHETADAIAFATSPSSVLPGDATRAEHRIVQRAARRQSAKLAHRDDSRRRRRAFTPNNQSRRELQALMSAAGTRSSRARAALPPRPRERRDARVVHASNAQPVNAHAHRRPRVAVRNSDREDVGVRVRFVRRGTCSIVSARAASSSSSRRANRFYKSEKP